MPRPSSTIAAEMDRWIERGHGTRTIVMVIASDATKREHECESVTARADGSGADPIVPKMIFLLAVGHGETLPSCEITMAKPSG